MLINADRELSRDAICRLGRSPESWLGLPCDTATAGAIGVRLRHLEVAHRLAEHLDKAAIERERLRRAEIEPIFLFDDDYPTSLLDLELPPPVLFRRGCLDQTPRISIVGPRRPDAWAVEVTRWFARELAAAGLVVVSGFARGVDSTAHKTALEARGKTLAVLGCGIDVDYPRGSKRLRQGIAKEGALLSEFATGTTPRPHHFPIRNRVIAALSFATLVIQADLRSGSLITARLALELGRDVLAVPGRPLDRKSRGSNALIRDGALVALEPDQILEALPLHIQDDLAERQARREEGATENSKQNGDESELDRRLLRLIEGEQKPAQQIAGELDIEVGATLVALTRLEISGRVTRCAGGTFLKSR